MRNKTKVYYHFPPALFFPGAGSSVALLVASFSWCRVKSCPFRRILFALFSPFLSLWLRRAKTQSPRCERQRAIVDTSRFISPHQGMGKENASTTIRLFFPLFCTTKRENKNNKRTKSRNQRPKVHQKGDPSKKCARKPD